MLKNNPNTNSIGSHKERKFDTIPFRLDFIRSLMDGKTLDPIVDLDQAHNTEYFVNPNGYIAGNTKADDESNDTRFVLNKKVHNFYKVINDIGGQLLYVKSGTTGHTFKGIVQLDDGGTINYAVKVCAYPKREKYGDIYDVRRPENAEIKMIRLLSYFVINKQTPHIVLPLGTFNTSIKPFVSLVEQGIIGANKTGGKADKTNQKYIEFVEKYKRGEYPDQVSVLISEWANRGDLLDFIRKNYREFTPRHWKVFFFQFVSTLAVIHSKFPGFRHNDLKANNILVHKVNNRQGTYTVAGYKYNVPPIGYRIKLWDFDFACIPGIVENAKVSAEWTNDINVKPVQNRYYDLHYFFNTLIKKGFFPQFLEDPIIPKEAQEFVFRVVPPNLQTGQYITDKGRILTNTEYILPADIIRNDIYFNEFRVIDPPKQINLNVSVQRNNQIGQRTGQIKINEVDINKLISDKPVSKSTSNQVFEQNNQPQEFNKAAVKRPYQKRGKKIVTLSST